MFVRIPENMIYKGLDEDESTFLQFVADRQAERDDELVREEIKEVSAYRVWDHCHADMQKSLLSNGYDSWAFDTPV